MKDIVETAAPKVFNLTTAEKAELMGVSKSFLHKDRMRDEPLVPFRQYGPRIVRYAAED